jgi:hypothetical protein
METALVESLVPILFVTVVLLFVFGVFTKLANKNDKHENNGEDNDNTADKGEPKDPDAVE